MAAQLVPSFVGGFYKSLSPSFAADQAVNIFTETRKVPGSPKQSFSFGTPGLDAQTTLGTLGERGWFTQDGRTFCVFGDTLYERNSATSYTSRGTIPDNGEPVSFVTNGQGGDQLGIVGGGQLNVFDLSTNTLSVAVLPFANPVMAVFLDGYTLINQRDTPIFWYSALEDMTSWDALDFTTRSGVSDNLVALAIRRDRILAIGTKTTTEFYDSGDVDTPFLPYTGQTFQVGIAFWTLVQTYDDLVVWVAQRQSGQRCVVAFTDGPQEVSTPPIDLWLNSCDDFSDATSFTYAQEGHTFIGFTVPNASGDLKTYATDLNERFEWHARAGWNSVTGRYTRWRVNSCTVLDDGTVLGGDYQTGDVYALDLNTYDDNGSVLRRERTVPYVAAENQWLFIDQFELGMQPGVGLNTGQGSAPVVTLEISRDGAHTWVNAGNASLGAIGNYTSRAIWRRLGRARSDRLVFRVTQTDPVKTAWGPGAWITAQPGTGQL